MSKNSSAGDRISNLPDPLLHHIHYFLETKDAARSSVLSKRWYYIWTTVPALDFHIHSQSNDYSITSSSETEKFMDFVHGTLQRRHNSSNVDRFYLSWTGQLNESLLHSWISTLIRGSVKELSLRLHKPCPSSFPPSLFTCESLTLLELGGTYYHNFTFPKSMSFPSLKRLKRKEFKFSDECWNEELFSNAPVLEQLILKCCIFDIRNLFISIPTLKLLTIQSLETSPLPVGGLDHCALRIHAPNLVTFTYKAEDVKEYVSSSFPTLVEAVVCLYYMKDGAETSRLLQALAHVKILTINYLTLQAICSAYDQLNSLPTFHNVKMLRISDSLTTDQGLLALLKAVPKLESLVFDGYFSDEEEYSNEDDVHDNDDFEGSGEDVDSVEDENNHDNEEELDISGDSEDENLALDSVTDGLFPHLKSVCFQELAGTPMDLRWVKLILRNAKVLQMMTFHYDDSASSSAYVKSEKEVMVDIPRFPRASPGCALNFYSWDRKLVILH